MNNERDTTWDEEDTTSDVPFLPGELGGKVSASQAAAAFLSRLYREGISQQIIAMVEDRIPVNKIIETIPEIRQEGHKLIVPIVLEKMVLVKKTVLIEELVLTPKFDEEIKE